MNKNITEIDIYDFDKTIVPFESGTRFLLFCVTHYPWLILYLPVVGVAGLLMALRVISLKAFKRYCFGFVKFIPLEAAVRRFWDKNAKKANEWVKNKSRTRVIISASPDFLLGDIAKRLDFDYVISTRYDMKTMRVIGENCRDDEKVKRFKDEFPNAKVIDVYSDSIEHDRPIFSLATGTCYNVEDKYLIDFDYDEMYGGIEVYYGK